MSKLYQLVTKLSYFKIEPTEFAMIYKLIARIVSVFQFWSWKLIRLITLQTPKTETSISFPFTKYWESFDFHYAASVLGEYSDYNGLHCRPCAHALRFLAAFAIQWHSPNKLHMFLFHDWKRTFAKLDILDINEIINMRP